ncbi:hypothetical protein GCM10025771_00800 [Niveibacterium umoris]|uniref:ParA family protein n=1 Tax=Niveibacterium umoris TaxID=1193620 RepID=A0A840BS82_9RHOO|nr:hypothetical protein [Niveibacterium umoris]MBB4014378.1 hypothetical protein [Niveibacterium umoris]
MAEIISIIGNKGGTGKTTLSHTLSHGFTLLGRRTACVMTDEDREPLSPAGRRYVIADARSPVARNKVVEKLRELKSWIGVLDGGANRTITDITLYQMSDVVLLPFRDSEEDLRTVMRDLDLLPKAWALPSQWPRNRFQLDAATRLIDTLPLEFRERILPPFFALSSSKLLLQERIPDELPAQLNNSARALAKQILAIFEDPQEDVASALELAAASGDEE